MVIGNQVRFGSIYRYINRTKPINICGAKLDTKYSLNFSEKSKSTFLKSPGYDFQAYMAKCLLDRFTYDYFLRVRL